MTPEELWALPAHEFNEWREKNDIPRLFNFFKGNLPGFKEWLDENNFTKEFLVQLRSPGELFHGDSEKVLFEKSDTNIDNRYSFGTPKSARSLKRIFKNAKSWNTKTTLFKPYILWAKQKFRKENFIEKKHFKVSTLRYTSGSAPNIPQCQWQLLGITVLKLGAVTIKKNVHIKGRNLDFTNLDFLTIEGDYHGDSMLNIFYSHCHNIKLSGGTLNFCQFFECDVNNLRLENESLLYGSAFIEGNVFNLVSINSSLRNIVFQRTSLSRPRFDNTFIEGIVYKPQQKEYHSYKAGTLETISDNYKRLRICFSKQGDRSETKKCYYYERKYDMLLTMWQINSFRGSYKISRKFKHNVWTIKRLLFDLRKSSVNFLKSIPKAFNFLFWGFGERPQRLIIVSLCIMLIYTLTFLKLNIYSSLIENVYLSLFSFVRVGDSSISQFSNQIKLLIGSEALFGWIIIVFIINSYANKTRY